jgi:hypothetical protein
VTIRLGKTGSEMNTSKHMVTSGDSAGSRTFAFPKAAVREKHFINSLDVRYWPEAAVG